MDTVEPDALSLTTPYTPIRCLDINKGMSLADLLAGVEGGTKRAY